MPARDSPAWWRAARRPGASRSCAARATTAPTGSSPRATCARPDATSRCCSCGRPSGWARTPQAQLKRLPGAKPLAFEAGRLNRTNVIVDALLGTGSSGSPREPADKVIEEMDAAKAPGHRRRLPVGRGRLDRRGRGSRGPLRRDRDVPPAQARPVRSIRARPTRARSRSIDIGIPRGGPVRPEAGLIGSGVLREMPRRAAGSTKFSSGNVVIIGGSRGPDGRAVACPRWPRCGPERGM